MSGDKQKGLECFANSCTNPDGADAVKEAFSMSSDQDKAAETVSGWSAAEVQELAYYQRAAGTDRSDEDMDRFCGAIEAASMSDDKVAVAVAECEQYPNPPFTAEQLVRVLKCYSFSSDAAKVLAQFAGPMIVYPMTCADAISVLAEFNMSDDKLAVLPMLKPFIYDAQNKIDIVSFFNFSSDKEKAEEILRDLVCKWKPKVPPMDEIQKALQKVGTCPSGYDYLQVQGGWRCQAGGHFVSDATLAQAMG